MQGLPPLRKLPQLLTSLLAGLFVVTSAIAAPLHSKVRDAQGKSLPNIVVKLLAPNGTEIAAVTSDSQGQAFFPEVTPGHYIIEAGDVASNTVRESFNIGSTPPAIVTLVLGGADPDVQTLQVQAVHLRNARSDLSSKIGTTIYTIDEHMISSMAQGEDTPFNDVLMHLPGVGQDSKASGSLHVRDDHGNVQYRINGIELPEGISGFGQSIDSRLIDQVEFITGAVPAQYGLRTAGIVEIQTKDGNVNPGGHVGILTGSRDFYEPSAEIYGGVDNYSYYLSGSVLSNAIGIENPQASSKAVHDRTRQAKTFGSFSYFLDGKTRLGLLFGTYKGQFQIPNNPDQTPAFSLTGHSDASAGTSTLPSSQLNENQDETNRFVVASLQKNLGTLSYQLSAFHQYSELHFMPDSIGDLIYNGVASDTLRTNQSNGIQLDSSYKLNSSNTLRAGLSYIQQATLSNNAVAVFQTDNAGTQTSSDPITITDSISKTGRLASFYVQNEWHIAEPLTLNYGVRFDHVSAFIDEQQWSPRINLAYQWSEELGFHAGYSRYFTPPPQELAAQSSINQFIHTTNAAEISTSDNVKAERTHYFDIGVSKKINDKVTLTADVYYKRISNLIDEGQFGQAIILSPFNYDSGYAKGIELSAIYSTSHTGGFLNLSYQKAQARHIVSGQALFGLTELNYIANNDIYLDHNQTFSISGGAHYHFGDSLLSADFLAASGLRKTPDGGTPNAASLPSYATLNTTFTHNWKNSRIGNIEGRISLVNLFDKSYLLRDGSGVGVGAPQYGPRRTVFLGVSTSF